MQVLVRMRRFAAYNGMVAAAFLLLWVLLVVVEVKISLFWFLKYVYAASLPLVFVGFFLAVRRAMGSSSKDPIAISVVSSLAMSPVLIFVGGVLATNFKFLIGGHL